MPLAETCFGTSSVDPASQLVAWNRAVRDLHFEMAFEASSRKKFDGTLRSYADQSFRIVVFEEQATTITRDERHVRADGSDVLELLVPIDGGFEVEQDGAVARCGAGSFVLVDAAKPFQLRQPARISALILKMGRQSLRNRLLDLEGACGRIIDCGVGMPRLVVDALGSLASQCGYLSSPSFLSGCESVVGLLGEAIIEALSEQANLSTSQMAIFRRARDRLRERACDHDLRLQDVACDIGISERYIQLLFTRRGTTFSDCLRRVRLARARETLARTGERHKTVTEVAYECGFSNSAYFSTAFRETYGQTPSEYRRSVFSATGVLQ
jgi:AraC-like DNA-binding protein